MKYALLRLFAILKKELIHIRQDFITYAMLICSPLIQVILFGYVINNDPKQLSTVILSQDNSIFSRNLISDLKNTLYFKVIANVSTEVEAEKLIRSGKTLFVLNIPTDFSKDLVQEKQPRVLLEADGTDPVAIVNAINAAKNVAQNYSNHYANSALDYLNSDTGPPFDFDVQIKYNPALISQYHTLPGLIVVIISITLPMIAALSITREYEYGTMESLLITPVRPREIIFGKIIPLIILGYILLLLMLMISYFIFDVPFHGNLLIYLLIAFFFFVANLGVGLLASTISKTQFRAAYVTNTYVLPATLFSGFLFPFSGMPYWAQFIGNIFPPAHFLRITTNMLMKGASFVEVWSDVLPIIIFAIVTFFIATRYYRRTLD